MTSYFIVQHYYSFHCVETNQSSSVHRMVDSSEDFPAAFHHLLESHVCGTWLMADITLPLSLLFQSAPPSGASFPRLRRAALPLPLPQLRVTRLPVRHNAQGPVTHTICPKWSWKHCGCRQRAWLWNCGQWQLLWWRVPFGVPCDGVGSQPLLNVYCGSAGRAADLQHGLTRRLTHTIAHPQPCLCLHIHRWP